MRKATGSYRTYSIPDKTAALIPEFAMEDLPSAELQARFLRLQRRTCPWAGHSDDDITTGILVKIAYLKTESILPSIAGKSVI